MDDDSAYMRHLEQMKVNLGGLGLSKNVTPHGAFSLDESCPSSDPQVMGLQPLSKDTYVTVYGAAHSGQSH